MRIGHGYDAHRFKEGNELVIGGVHIPFEKAFDAHSDGDVLIHAICDSLLGALALGDIGQHFPDTSEDFAGIDSRVLLRHVISLVNEKSYRVGNIDATVIAQRPKLMPFIPAMRDHLANDMGVPLDCVNVKGTTTEKMGFAGREEGIAAHAVALLMPLS